MAKKRMWSYPTDARVRYGNLVQYGLWFGISAVCLFMTTAYGLFLGVGWIALFPALIGMIFFHLCEQTIFRILELTMAKEERIDKKDLPNG